MSITILVDFEKQPKQFTRRATSPEAQIQAIKGGSQRPTHTQKEIHRVQLHKDYTISNWQLLIKQHLRDSAQGFEAQQSCPSTPYKEKEEYNSRQRTRIAREIKNKAGRSLRRDKTTQLVKNKKNKPLYNQKKKCITTMIKVYKDEPPKGQQKKEHHLNLSEKLPCLQDHTPRLLQQKSKQGSLQSGHQPRLHPSWYQAKVPGNG